MVGDITDVLYSATTNSYTCRWDTLCFGNIVPIIANQAGPGAARLHSIHPRNPALVMKDRQLTRDKFLALAKNVTWALAHGSTEPDSGLLFREDGIEWMGLTTKHDLYRNVRCYFDIRIISPLLRDDLKVRPGGTTYLIYD